MPSHNGGSVARFNTRTVRPFELTGLSDAEFRAVVDADLRRRVSPDNLTKETSMALRSPENNERWHTTLLGIRASVEGQLRSADDEYEMQRLALEADIGRIPPTQSTRLAAMYEESNALRKEYLSKRAARERFLTGLNEHVVAAEASLGQGSADRDARRVRVLEQAIEAHRRAVLQDLDDGEEPAQYEELLWAVLAATDD